MILELGANDMLRGVDPALTREGARRHHRKAEGAQCHRPAERDARATQHGNRLCAGLRRDLSGARLELRAVVFYPFFLDGVAADNALNQRDGLHPTAAGVDVIVARILPKVEELIARVQASRSSSFGPSAMPRLFTGLEIPQEVAQSLAMLRGGLPGARWIDPENYHMTLRFIGDVDDAVAHEVASMLGRARPRGSFEIRLEGVTSFGSKKPPRAVVAAARARGPH